MQSSLARSGLAGVALVFALAGCPKTGGGGGGGGGPTIDVKLEGLTERAFHVSRTLDELVFEVRVLTPDGAPHPTARFWWNYPGHLYGGLLSTPDPDMTYVEETGAGGLQRLRVRSTKTKRGGIYVGCYADVFGALPDIPEHQAVCAPQAVRFWGGKALDLVLPVPDVKLGVGEVRSIQPLALAEASDLNGGASDEEVTCTVADPAIAAVTSTSSRCVFTAKAVGQTTFTAHAGTASRSWPLAVTAAVPGPPPASPLPSGLGVLKARAPSEDPPPGVAPGRGAGVSGTGVSPPSFSSFAVVIPATLLVSSPKGDLAFGAWFSQRQAVFEWTGTGFGWTVLSPPWVAALHPPVLGYDARGALYAAIMGYPELLVAAREPGAAPGAFQVKPLPATDAVTGVELSQLDDSDPVPRPREGSAWWSTLPREGGGQWLAWIAVKGWDEYPHKRCRFVLELAELDEAFTVKKETVLVSEKLWFGAVSGGAKFDCTGTRDPVADFSDPIPQLVATGPSGKPDLDLWRRDSTFPATATGSDRLTLTPAGLVDRHLRWNGVAWTSTPRWAPDATRHVARSPNGPWVHLAEVFVGDAIAADPVRKEAYGREPDPREPERWVFAKEPRLLLRARYGYASTVLPGPLVYELLSPTLGYAWDVPDALPPHDLLPALLDAEGPIVRPPVVLASGKRFAFLELVAKPYLFGDPGAKVVAAAAREAPWSVVAEPGSTFVLPLPFATFTDRAWPVGGAMYSIAALNLTGEPVTARSDDGATWTNVPSGAFPATASPTATAWIAPDGVGFALTLGSNDVWRTADVTTGVWTKVDDLSADLAAIDATISSRARDRAWAISADGQTAALVTQIYKAPGLTEALLVRRYTRAGVLLDSRVAPIPPGVDFGLGDRFEPTGAALAGDRLVLQRGEVGTPGLDLIPVTLDLATGTWADGPRAARIYMADPFAQNLWHLGLQGQFPALDRTAWSFLVMHPLADGTFEVFGTDVRPGGREALFHAKASFPPGSSALTLGAKTWLATAGGYHLRLSGVAPEPGGGWFVLYGDGVRPYMQFGALENAWAYVPPP
ncbi:MAG: hypothetical protein U0229_21605 [Anaeromyxobacter sp.]